MKTHRAFARQNAGYWEGCIEYPCRTVSAVTNAKHTEGAALDIAQRMIEGADARYAKAQSDAEYRRQYRLGRVMAGEAIRHRHDCSDRNLRLGERQGIL